MKLVIIGGDAAGMSAASRAKRRHPEYEVTVLEQGVDVSYSACGMPYNIADPERDMSRLVVRTANEFIEKNGINLLTGHRALKIDRMKKTVSGRTTGQDPFCVEYDKLLIATGAAPVIPDIPGIDLPGVLTLKSLEDGRRIKSGIAGNGVKTAVIVGMGYIALEMCESFRKRGIAVTLIKPGPAFLPWMREELSQVIFDELREHDVEILAGVAIRKIESAGSGLRVISDHAALETDMVLVAAGVRPLNDMAKEAGLATGPADAIAVDRNLLTSDKNIYAAGDCSDAYHVVTGRKCWIPLALRANRAGWAAADHICGNPAPIDGVAGTSVFKVFSLEVARSGISLAEAEREGFDPVEVVVKTRSRAHGQPGSGTIHVAMTGDRTSRRLLGVQMVGSEGVAHRINAAAVALHNHMTVEGFAQTDLAYAPPFGPVWDPLLVAANQLVKKL